MKVRPGLPGAPLFRCSEASASLPSMAAFTVPVDSTAELTRVTLAANSDNVGKVNESAKAVSILGVDVARAQPWSLEELAATFDNHKQPVWIHR